MTEPPRKPSSTPAPRDATRDATRRQFLSGLAVSVAGGACSSEADPSPGAQGGNAGTGTGGTHSGGAGTGGVSTGGTGTGGVSTGGVSTGGVTTGGSDAGGAASGAGGADVAAGAGTESGAAGAGVEPSGPGGGAAGEGAGGSANYAGAVSIEGGAAGADAGAGGGPGGPKRKTAQDRVILGKTGIEVSRLAMGSGTNPGSGLRSAQSYLPDFPQLLVQGYDLGITFWETADQYKTHAAFKTAIAEVGRQNLVIMTKTKAKDLNQAQKYLSRYLKELGTDYIDILLLHQLESPTWSTDLAEVMQYYEEAKQAGIIRAHGISCHTLDALRLSAKNPWVDVQLSRINPAGILMDSDPATVISVLREMKAINRGVIGMKILGEGQLAGQLDMALAHAVGLDCIDCFTIGFTNRAQLVEVIDKIAAV
jgi:aryl-alcohol dehydrogenase-like predicted oxidoreductase